MKNRIKSLVLVCWLAIAAGPVVAQEPLAEKVKKAIDKGVGFLRQQQSKDGGWSKGDGLAASQPGGESCLVMLALLEAGVPLSDPMMVKGLEHVRNIKSPQTYVRGLQTQVLVKAGKFTDSIQIANNADWLVNARIFKGNKLSGWSYTANLDTGKPFGNNADGSNTQFALLGLWAGKEARVLDDKGVLKPVVEIKVEVWKSVRDHYIDNQEADGSWRYVPGASKANNMTMTTAGMSGLILSGLEIQEGREVIGADGQVKGCGQYKDNPNLVKGMQWLEKNFEIDLKGSTYYNLYGIERLGRLTGYRYIGSHDWYREGCEFLVMVKKQSPDGSWSGAKFFDEWPTISTSFALLFLSKGRTPVLISKLVHGPWPRVPGDNDWNLDRHAIKNLTEHISKELFTLKDKDGARPMPLAWQIFDLMQAYTSYTSKLGVNEKAYQTITEEMLQSPIIFINGHDAPQLTQVEMDLLKQYVENGGFIFAETCCGSKDFDKGFKELVKKIWENNDLVKLSDDHPIWNYPAEVKPGTFNLHGLEMGCKTVLVYSPEDMSCYWEGNNPKASAKSELAFRTAANIIAYATGMVPPLPRLTEINIASKEKDQKDVPRFYFKVAQLYHRKDWVPPAPAAMSNLMSHLRKFAGMDVVLKTEKMAIDHEDLPNFKFIYFHDRGKFQFDDGQLKGLRFNLETGGLLFADACCGSKIFDASFRDFAKQLFPKHTLQPVPADDPLFGAALNGKALTKDNIKARQEIGKPLQAMKPWLEGIKIDGRWVVLYSKYDIGCALERHTANDCIGYDHDSAVRIASAAVLYLMSP